MVSEAVEGAIRSFSEFEGVPETLEEFYGDLGGIFKRLNAF